MLQTTLSPVWIYKKCHKYKISNSALPPSPSPHNKVQSIPIDTFAQSLQVQQMFIKKFPWFNPLFIEIPTKFPSIFNVCDMQGTPTPNLRFLGWNHEILYKV